MLRATFFMLCTLTPVAAQEWFVAGTGDDGNSGTIATFPFRTLQHAAGVARAGDTVLIGDGTYTGEPDNHDNEVLLITSSGTADAWITWKAQPGTTPVLRSTGWSIIRIRGSYHHLDGLTVLGHSEELNLADALADGLSEKPDSRYNTNGICIEGRKQQSKPHHITIRNCSVGRCPGGGIVGLEADHLTVEDCRVFDNCWYMRYAGSGITTLDSWQSDQDPGYHLVFQRNLVWNNRTLVPWGKTGKLSDGNGILLDVTEGGSGPANPLDETPAQVDGAAKKNGRPEWTARSLVANNVSCDNGGSGIHCFRTRNVDIVNNTTYHNGSVVGYPELFANNCTNVRILNNAVIPRAGAAVTSNNRNTDVLWDHNIYPTAQTVLAGPHDVIADPLFVKPGNDPSTGDFHLQPGSPAIGSGCTIVPLTTTRNPDLGAYAMPGSTTR